MTVMPREERYSSVAILFHWSIAALVIANLAIGLLHENVLDGVGWAIPLHKSFGVTVLVLTLGRIGWRLTHRPPPLPASTPRWEKGAAHGVHWVLYALMLAMPLTGWMLSSGGRRYPISWFGLFDVPFLPVSRATGSIAHDAHGLLGWLMLALVALHAAAALRHHLVLRDRVLARMAPALDRTAQRDRV